MDEQDRRRLQSNRSFIVKNLQNVMEVNSLLFEFEVFTEGMKEDVEAERTRENKVRKLLDIVPRRGPTAFQKFIKALVNSDNEFVAETLQSGASSSYRSSNIQISTNEDLPETWPDERLMTEPIRVTHVSSSQQLPQYCYDMKSNPRGRVLVISNKIFYGPLIKDENGKNQVLLQTREGAECDVNRIKELFTQLHFQVEVHIDLKADKIESCLMHETSLPIHAAADCFVLVIMTHGLRNAIYGVDGKTVQIENIKRILNGANFPSMASKPKIVLIQACRGEKRDKGITATVDPQLNVDEAIKGMKKLHLDTVTDSSGEMTEPTMSHMVVAMATTLDMVSYRNRLFGSWFLQAVVYVFQRYAYTDEISQLFYKVNRLVSKGIAKSNEQEYRAISEFQSTFSRSFYFSPGVYNSINDQGRIQHPTS